MTDSRLRRQAAITDLLGSRRVGNHQELVDALADQGFTVTQATISRDLEQLGAVKIRRGGQTIYAMPDEQSATSPPEGRLAAILREWVRSIEPAGTLIVLRTPPGSAHLVGVALDQTALPGLVGNICGDDTIFAAVTSAAEARRLADLLKSLRSGTGR